MARSSSLIQSENIVASDRGSRTVFAFFARAVAGAGASMRVSAERVGVTVASGGRAGVTGASATAGARMGVTGAEVVGAETAFAAGFDLV
jgi:hypothetical protein